MSTPRDAAYLRRVLDNLHTEWCKLPNYRLGELLVRARQLHLEVRLSDVEDRELLDAVHDLAQDGGR